MTDVFGSTTTTPDKSAVETTTEVKPVKTADDRLKDKDDFINQLKNEMAELRKELSQKLDAEKHLEELRNEIKSIKEQRVTNVQSRENTTPALSEVDIRTLVQQTITDTEVTKTKEQNIREANDSLVNNFGGDTKKAVEAVQAKANELGVSVEFLKDVASKSPTAFLEVMGAKKSETKVEGTTFTQGSVNTEGVGKDTKVVLKEGSKAFFDNLRKTNPQKYWTPEVQQQLWKAAKDNRYWAA